MCQTKWVLSSELLLCYKRKKAATKKETWDRIRWRCWKKLIQDPRLFIDVFFPRRNKKNTQWKKCPITVGFFFSAILFDFFFFFAVQNFFILSLTLIVNPYQKKENKSNLTDGARGWMYCASSIESIGKLRIMQIIDYGFKSRLASSTYIPLRTPLFHVQWMSCMKSGLSNFSIFFISVDKKFHELKYRHLISTSFAWALLTRDQHLRHCESLTQFR